MPTPTVPVRAATPTDAAAVAEIYLRSWRAAFGHLLTTDRVPDQVLRTRGAGFVDRPLCLVALAAGVPCALAAGDPGTGLLEVLYAHPASWGTGAAAALLERATVELACGGQRPRLWVWQDNRRARAFYTRHGWRPSGRVRSAVIDGLRFDYAELHGPPA